MDDNASVHRTDDASSRLDGVVIAEYYGPPGRLDEEIAQLLLSRSEGAPEEWGTFADSLTEQQRMVLGRYALRAPMLALRTKSPRHLSAGLLAHSLLRRRVTDWRDDLVFFAPYTHVARLLGVDVVAIFDEAATHAVPDLSGIMRTFGRRTDVSLAAFGWRQVDTPDGPTFETVHWNGSPSGAVVGERSWDEVNRALVQEILDWVQKQTEADDAGAQATS
jgi:hypothetical protein